MKELIYQEIDRNSVVFEHGMCACIGGLDRAHMHVMSIQKIQMKKVFRIRLKIHFTVGKLA